MRISPLKITISLIVYFFSFIVYADPSPFGLIINKTTIEELKNKYNAQPLGFNKTNDLQAFELSPDNLNFAGLLSAKAAFSNDQILKLVQLSLPQTKFDEIYSNFKNKYTFLYKNNPGDGNKEAKFEQDNTYIVLYTTQNSEEMDILYINKSLLEEVIKVTPVNNVAHQEVSQL